MKLKRTAAKVILRVGGVGFCGFAAYLALSVEGPMGVWDVMAVGIFAAPGLVALGMAERTLRTVAPYLPFVEEPEEDT